MGLAGNSRYRECHRNETSAASAVVKVKTCGKSARRLVVISGGDKPCGLKCHVCPDPVRRQGLLALISLGKVGRGRQIDPGREARAR